VRKLALPRSMPKISTMTPNISAARTIE
jgi:hypothetical protein